MLFFRRKVVNKRGISLYIMKFSLFTLFSKKLGPMKCPIFGSKGTWSPAKGYGGIDLVKLICSVDRVPWPTPGDTVVLAGNREVWQWEEVKAATGQLTSVLIKICWAESSSELFWSPVVCRPSIYHSGNFSHFYLVLKNHQANFNQTWHKASLGEEDLSLFKWRTLLFSKGR